ncbi:hypothetical protein IW261DRAFT_455730 [Armillaria novae-zelandiae]|uniref:Uncharacterized protein n=1 Tax=Armillaria novae-zelandiae TaxID=153914 RepID=A0AA39P2G6_9AGAR|nr:hypothetical protein IW261DRAFT_455730 [Armillaria novae-zelandiae]
MTSIWLARRAGRPRLGSYAKIPTPLSLHRISLPVLFRWWWREHLEPPLRRCDGGRSHCLRPGFISMTAVKTPPTSASASGRLAVFLHCCPCHRTHCLCSAPSVPLVRALTLLCMIVCIVLQSSFVSLCDIGTNTRITIAEHRKAIVRLLTSAHPLAVEVLRWSERRQPPVPPNLRFCRYCQIHIEDELHALWHCVASPKTCGLRTQFFHDVFALAPDNFWSHLKTVPSTATVARLFVRTST